MIWEKPHLFPGEVTVVVEAPGMDGDSPYDADGFGYWWAVLVDTHLNIVWRSETVPVE